MEEIEPEILKDSAKKAIQFSHSPYSKYRVGAAILTDEGKIFLGCNIESSSYSLSMCAERVAIATAIANGHKRFLALAIYSANGAMPCGACRQIIWEICGDIPIFVFDESGKVKKYRASELLPEPFDAGNLKRGKGV